MYSRLLHCLANDGVVLIVINKNNELIIKQFILVKIRFSNKGVEKLHTLTKEQDTFCN